MVVGADVFSHTEIKVPIGSGIATGRLSVDVAVDPAVDQTEILIAAGERLKVHLLQSLRDVLDPRQQPNAVAKHELPAVCMLHECSVILDDEKWDQGGSQYRKILVE